MKLKGNFGIGTTSPNYPLEMGSGAYVTTGGVWTDASSIEYKENITKLSLKVKNLFNIVKKYTFGRRKMLNLKKAWEKFDAKDNVNLRRRKEDKVSNNDQKKVIGCRS